MYAYLKGRLAFKSPTNVILDVGGIGYEVQISLYTYGKIEPLEQVQLWVQLIVREDSHTMFGFFEQEEKELFNHLISVSGIGPNTGRLILSGMAPGDVQSAILTEDELSFKRVKGVGPKTAKRLIIELKDKLTKTPLDISATIPISQDNSSRQEALSALMALGFAKNQVQKAILKVSATLPENPDTEDWVKAALQELSG